MIKNLKLNLLLTIFALSIRINIHTEEKKTLGGVYSQIRQALNEKSIDFDTLVQEISDIDQDTKQYLIASLSQYLDNLAHPKKQSEGIKKHMFLSTILKDYINENNITNFTADDINFMVKDLAKRIVHHKLFSLLRSFDQKIHAITTLEKIKELKKDASPKDIDLLDQLMFSALLDFFLSSELKNVFDQIHILDKDNKEDAVKLNRLAQNVMQVFALLQIPETIVTKKIAPTQKSNPMLSPLNDIFELQILPLAHNIFKKNLSSEDWNVLESIGLMQEAVDKNIAMIKIIENNPGLLKELYDAFVREKIGEQLSGLMPCQRNSCQKKA